MKKNLILIGFLILSHGILTAQNPKNNDPKQNKQSDLSKETKISTVLIQDCGLEVKTKDEAGSFAWNDAKVLAESTGQGWRLPSKAELDCLNKNKDKIGGFKRDWYWSSDQVGQWNSWVQSFSNGKQFGYSRANAAKVRFVRSLKK